MNPASARPTVTMAMVSRVGLNIAGELRGGALPVECGLKPRSRHPRFRIRSLPYRLAGAVRGGFPCRCGMALAADRFTALASW